MRLSLNGNRKVVGVLRGYDAFLNVVLEETIDETTGGAENQIGTVVVRGSSIVQFESLERIVHD
jgi:small nuclear ribonucleoprotein G